MNKKFIAFLPALFIFILPSVSGSPSDYTNSFDVILKANTTSILTGGIASLNIPTNLTGFDSVCCFFEIVNKTGSEPINYFIDNGYNTGNTTLWINISYMPNGAYTGTVLTVYYNNNTPVSNQTNNPSPLNSSWKVFATLQNQTDNYVLSGTALNQARGGSVGVGATINDPNAYIQGPVGNGLSTGGKVRYLSVATKNLIDVSQSWSIGLWFKPNGTNTAFSAGGADQAFYHTGGPSTAVIMKYSSGNIVIDGFGSAGSLSHAYTFGTNSWHFLTMTKSGNTLKLYINGTMVSSITNYSPSDAADENANAFGHSERDSSPMDLNGTIDLPFITTHVLSDSEINMLFNSTSYSAQPPAPVSNQLLFTNQTSTPSSLFPEQLLLTNISIVNSTTNGTVGIVYVSFNNTNFTMAKIADSIGNYNGGTYTFNWTINGIQHGNYTIRYYATETISSTNQTNAGITSNVEVLTGINTTITNEMNGTAITNYNIHAFNSSYNYYFFNQNNQAYLQFDRLPTGSFNLTFYKNGYENKSIIFSSNPYIINHTSSTLDRYQSFRAADNVTGGFINSFSISATNGTFTSSSFSTSTGFLSIPLSDLPLGNSTFTVIAAGFATNITSLNLTSSSELNTTFFMLVSAFTVNVFDEQNKAPISNFTITLSNSTYSTSTFVSGSTFNSNTTALPIGESKIDIVQAEYVQRSYYVTLSQSSALTLNAYLLNNTQGIFYNFNVRTTSNVPIENALITIQKNYNGTITPVAQIKTDSAGTGNFWMNLFTNYVVKIEADGYVSLTFNQIPQTITGATTVVLFSTGAQGAIDIGFNTPYTNISYQYTPTSPYQNNSFLTGFTISDSSGGLQYIAFNVSYVNNTNATTILWSHQNLTGSPSGGTLTYTIPFIVGTWQIQGYYQKNNTIIVLPQKFYTLINQTGTVAGIEFNFNQPNGPSRGLFFFIVLVVSAIATIFARRFSEDASVFVPLVIMGIATFFNIVLWYELLLILLITIFVYILWRRPF